MMTFNMLLERTTITADETFAHYLERAEEIMKEIDLDDAPFIALALSFPNDGIWSNDKDLDGQSVVRVWKTHELYELLQNRKIR
jgi:predicted nucleic acid-binding protein